MAAHPYTRALLSAIPIPDPRRHSERIVLEGDVPTPLSPPPGCRFHTRCPAVMDRCRAEEPRAVHLGDGQRVKCFHAYDVDPGTDAYANVVRRTDERVTSNRSSSFSVTSRRPPVRPRVSAPPRESSKSKSARRSTASGARMKSRRGFIAAAVLLIAGGLMWSRSQEPAEVTRARGQLELLSGEIERHAALTGEYPRSLADLGWRLPPVVGGREARDPWGERWLYRTPGQGRAAFDLGSVGPDGLLGGDDDVGRPFDDDAPNAGPRSRAGS